MPFVTGAKRVSKRLLVWPVPVPDRVRGLFAVVFMGVFDMIEYVSRDISKTDAFCLVIPLDCYEQLRNDPVSEFRQVKHIIVVCDLISNVNSVQRRYSAFMQAKVKFYTIEDILTLPREAEMNEALASSEPIDQNTQEDILLSNKAHLYAKKLAVFNRLSPFLKQSTSTSLHGLPVNNTNTLISRFACSSCALVYQQLHQLECKHHQCRSCLNVQTSCIVCSTSVSGNTTLLDLNMEMENLSTNCLGCKWQGTFTHYKEHFKQTHPELIMCLIDNLQINDDSLHNAIPSLNGSCLWRISDIDNIINKAGAGDQPSVYSSPFYLFPRGYKIRLRLFANGDSKGRDTHMSLFFVIMRGEYDENLQWPFTFQVTFTLIDQSTEGDKSQHVSQLCWPDTKLDYCFDRPQYDMNLPCGISKCFSRVLFEEQRNRYVCDNTMFITAHFETLIKYPSLSLMAHTGELPNDETRVVTPDDELLGAMLLG